jgi:hypothetical protein
MSKDNELLDNKREFSIVSPHSHPHSFFVRLYCHHGKPGSRRTAPGLAKTASVELGGMRRGPGFP